ncbi:MAG TPA: spore coat U domain-containing protein [Pseudolabrys sp.]|nr:spore coat U domain-containing protein [Pseudolabrys sp.]
MPLARRLFMILSFLTPLFAAAPAHALICTMSASDVAFGNVDVLSGAPADATGAVTIDCIGVPLTTLRICLNLNAGSGGADATSRFLLNGANALRYQLYQDSSHTVIWGSTTWGLPGGPPQIDLPLSVLGTASITVPMFGRIFGSQATVPPALYTSNFSGSNVAFAYAIIAAFDCGSILQIPPLLSAVSFNVTASVIDNCMVTAQPIDFGSHGVLNANADATGNISTVCTAGTNYTIGLDGGLSNGPPTARKMTKGAEAVTYGLYQDLPRTQPWGNTIASDTVAGVGSGLTQNYGVYARVPAQQTPSSGLYSDTVVVTVTY